MKRKRRETPPGEFVDPLSNYDPKTYSDEMERSLLEDTVADLKITPYRCLPPQATIETALKTMVDEDIACLMIAQGDKLLGVLSERDVLDKVAERYAQIKSHPVSEVMTPDPWFVHETDSPAAALNQMAVGGFRHIPVLDVNEKIVGILGPRRVTAYLMEHFERAAAS